MTWVDPQGRWLGKVSVVDLLALLFLLLLSPLALFGFRVLRPFPPEILEVIPSRAAPGESIRITGANFKHGVQVEIGGLPTRASEYYGSDLVVGYIPPELAPGRYPVRARNSNGAAGSWDRPLEVLPAPERPQVPVMLTFVFTELTPEEAARVQSLSQARAEPLSEDAPRLMRVLKHGTMKDFLAKPPAGSGSDWTGKEFVLADVALLAREAETPEGKRYFYRNQPLLFEFPVFLPLGGRTWTGVIHREPDPNRPELKN